MSDGVGTGRLTDLIRCHASALVLCALALLASVATLEDYGVRGDSYMQRIIADATLRYLAGDSDAFEVPPAGQSDMVYLRLADRFYGTAFEVPLLLVERVFGLGDSRSAYLVRHLLSHLFFLAAGFVGYLLALRLFSSRAVALFALALFLLHPRIYAHSFFNSKDVPFLALFMICLWLACRAFMGGGSREGGRGAAGSPGAFALCGVAAGLLVNLRVTGLAFVAVVVAVRVCDLRGARGERRLVLATLVVFLASAAVAYYASMPYLWADPFGRFAELLAVFSNHPSRPVMTFQGELISAAALPPHYVTVWFTLTTPPLALLLGAVGIASLARRGMARPGTLLRNTPLRFELLLAACVALPLLTIAVLRPPIFEDWRHMYFLWAPFALLAASGLRALADAAPRLRLPRHLPLTPRLAGFAVHGLVALGLAAVAVQMARLHPNQHLYFNALAIRTNPEPLHERYHLVDYVSSLKPAYAYILEESPSEIVNMQRRHRWTTNRERILAAVGPATPRNLELFPLFERQRITSDRNVDPDFYMSRSVAPRSALSPPVLYERRVYDSPIVRVETPHLARVDAATADAYRALYRDIAADAPAFGGDIDVYRSETAVTWVKEACAPGDLHWRASLTAHPADTDRFSAFTHPVDGTYIGGQVVRGRHHRHRAFTRAVDGVRIGGACLWQLPLPDHALAKIHLHGIGRLVSDAYLDELRARYAALAAMPPAARSTFDVHLQDGTLLYARTPCVQADIEAPFFLHVVPVDADDLHYSRRRHGFDAQDFRTDGTDPLWRYASADVFDGACMVERELPGYPVAHIATGQYVLGGTDLWRVDFSVEDG